MQRSVTVTLLAAASLAVVAGWVAGAWLMLQVAQIDGRVQLLQQRLAPVAPRDVLCGVSMQVQELHRQLAQHCGTVHDVVVPTIPLPAVCRPPTAHDPARYSPAYEGDE